MKALKNHESNWGYLTKKIDKNRRSFPMWHCYTEGRLDFELQKAKYGEPVKIIGSTF